MDLDDLICRAKQRSDDSGHQPFSKEFDWAIWASEGERQACMRASLIYDDTSDFCTIAILPGITSYELDHRILRISDENVRWKFTDSTRLWPVTMTGIDRRFHHHRRHHHHWHEMWDCDENVTGNRVDRIAQVNKTLHVWPKPSSTLSGSLMLGVYRLPLYPMEDGGDEPEIPLEQRDGLVDWMLYRAWSTKDPEQNDPQAAKIAYDNFEARFGPLESADVMRRHNERRSITPEYGGY